MWIVDDDEDTLRLKRIAQLAVQGPRLCKSWKGRTVLRADQVNREELSLKPLPLLRPTRVAALAVAAACQFFLLADTALANRRQCGALEQRHEQIKAAASPLETNAALFSAAEKGCVDLVRRLLADGASLKARDRLGAMPLSRAAAAGHAEIVELFLADGAPVDARNLDGSTALFLAAEEDNLTVVKALIARGADVNVPGRSGISTITAAAYMGNEPLVRLLVEAGADVNAIDATGKTAICYAVGRGFTPVVRLLIDRGVNVNRHYGNNLTALMWAAGYSDEAGVADVADAMSLLIESGARLDARDNRGRTALMIAAELGHTGAAELLIARGADRYLRDKNGKTAGDLARNEALRAVLAAK